MTWKEDFTYIIDDDFLPKEAVEEIHEVLLNSDAEWVLGKELLSKDYRFKTNIDPYVGSQFNHLFFIDSKIFSPHWELGYNLISQFCMKHNISLMAVMRCKSNLTFPDSRVDQSKTETPHVDHNWNHFTLLYYINDADGETILYNEKFDKDNEVVLTELARVSPKAGRAVLFNGLLYHSPTVPSKNYRAVINYTFLGEFNDLR